MIARLQRQGAMPDTRRTGRTRGSRLARSAARSTSARRRGLRRQDVADLTRELATMLAAGQDLDRALRFMVETAPARASAHAWAALRDAVRDGSPLSAAMAR